MPKENIDHQIFAAGFGLSVPFPSIRNPYKPGKHN